MSHLSYLLLTFQTAHADPVIPLKPMPKTPEIERLDGTSPVLEEKRRKKEEQERQKKENENNENNEDNEDNEENAAKAAANGGNNSSTGQVKLGTNIGAKPANYPNLNGAQTVEFNFPQGIDLMQLIRMMAQATGRNFILGDDIKGSVTVIAHKPLTVPEAYEAFLSILEVSGYTTVAVGANTKIVPTSGAANSPLRVGEGGKIPFTDNFVTQIIQLENVAATDISGFVKDLSGKSAKIMAYAPTNTLIITDSGVNIRRVYNIINQLDVAAPKSKLKIIPLQHATASEVEQVINELYGDEGSSSNNKSTSKAKSSRAKSKNKKSNETSSTATNVGEEGKYIDKIISDERTNSIIIRANEEALDAVADLVAKLDVDVDPASRAQIHVVYLEHAKAEDIAQVLSNLSQGTGSSTKNNRSTSRNNRNNRNNNNNNNNNNAASKTAAAADSSAASVVAAFDSGIRITHDENTNSLVIIATPDQIQYVKQVIDKLDIRRKQVFVEAVVLELSSDEQYEFGLGAHMGNANDDGTVSIFSSQLNGSSYGLSADLLSGMAMGVFGEAINVSVSDGLGGTADVAVPAFGVALNALQSNSSVNILSTPNILTLDNEEASIVVGRNIPFPVSTGRDNNNNPIISYQREDVAITLKVTPQINESNYVTLTVFQEVQEVEEDSQGLDVSTAGFITSKRSADTTVLVRDNQTVVIGGLIGTTDTTVETKIPLLGDIPIIGKAFRGSRTKSRKSNMLIFLTPHVIDDEMDLEEVYRIKVAQRQEFIRRFYGKSREQQEKELTNLLQYSMNHVDKPSVYRGSTNKASNWEVIGSEAPLAPALPEDENREDKDNENINIDLDEALDDTENIEDMNTIESIDDETDADQNPMIKPEENTGEEQ